MIKRILPIYQTGWFYLILLFLAAIFYCVSIGAFNPINQANLNLLEKTSSDTSLTNKIRFLAETDILTLHASLDEENISDIKTILSNQLHSQIVLLGSYSPSLIQKLTKHLSEKPRSNKILIDSRETFSADPIKVSSSTFFSSALNWFRFSDKQHITAKKSSHFIYTPLLLNQRQSYPLLWQYQDKAYLSLVGEILKQLSLQNDLTLKEGWQLSLINTQKTLGPEKLSLGFFGEVFTTGNAYELYHRGDNNTYLTSGNIGHELEKQTLPSIKQFIKQQYGRTATSSPKPQYKVIILTDNKLKGKQVIPPLLLKLTKNDYLSQNFITILLTWFMALMGLTLIWFIQGLTFKQQLTVIVTYVVVLFIFQSFMYNQQQWLEVFPAIFASIGAWLLLLAYHKEVNVILSHLDLPNEKQKTKKHPPLPTARQKTLVNKSKGVYKSPQNFSPTATTALESAPEPEPTSSSPVAEPENLEQTLVIADQAIKNPNTINHHITVDNFGRYQVEGILGKGAMGIVYQGVDPKINRHVAIKTLQLSNDIDSNESTEAKDRFFREAQTAGGLSHANIVTIYDVGEENNLGYIAMDLLTGAPLSLFTQVGQTLPIPLIYQLLIQITDALDYAHKQNIVHRDIKPSNIIYDDDLLKVTVTDFGIAYVSDHSKTRTGVIMGSPYYMSPEQILGLKVDGRSDIFSLGVTFYQLLSGHLPFEGESIATVAYQITKAKPTAVNQHNTALPASALRITNKAMHKDIDKRYQSMAEFKLALINALKRDFKITVN